MLGASCLGMLLAQGPTKPASINVQSAILSTKEGRKAAQDLSDRFNARKQTLEKKQADIVALQSRMRSGSATMSVQAKNQLIADIDTKTKEWNRDSQEFNTDVQQEESQLMSTIGKKMLDVIEKYSTEHSIFLVADVSNPQSPVIWANPALDITNDIIRMYDQQYPVAAPTPATPPAPAKKQ
jgi:outer membrane protein